MSTTKDEKSKADIQMPSAEEVQRELASAESMDDFFGKEGIFARLFSKTLEQMLEAEMTEHLGYEPYEAKGRNSGNNRNGHYGKKVRTSEGETTIQVPRDRNGEYEPKLVKKYASNTNELEEKIIGMYARGLSVRDIQDTLNELYGMEVSATTVSAITEKVWSLVETWQNRFPWKRYIPSCTWTPSISSCAEKVRCSTRLCTWSWASVWTVSGMFWGIGWAMAARAPTSG